MALTIAFFGASGGCGHASLTAALAAGHTCIAQCRVPTKLDELKARYPDTLTVEQGNAHSVSEVSACLTHVSPLTSQRQLVDAVNFSIGNKPDMKTMGFGDPNVCEKGMRTLLEALSALRKDESVAATGPSGEGPLLSIVSTTGISQERDIPLLVLPFYHLALSTPHEDKRRMEELVLASRERFVFVKPSLLVDGGCGADSKTVRVGWMDARTGEVERKEIGYTISRKAVGEWMYENILAKSGPAAGGKKNQYQDKAVVLTW